MDIGVFLGIDAAFLLDHLPRLHGRGGAVEIGQRLALHRPRQDGKIGADLLDGIGAVDDAHWPRLPRRSNNCVCKRTRRASLSKVSATSPRQASISSRRAVASSMPRLFR